MPDRDKPKLQFTRDYDLFEMDQINRPLSDKPLLLASMQKHGFMHSSPIQVVRGANQKLKVVRGHHRLDYAKRLGLPVCYVIDDSNTDIYQLEGDTTSRWTLRDFAVSRARAGNKDIDAVLAFQAKHGVTLGTAISLLGGESAGSENHHVKVKAGTFKVASDLSHARAVVDLTDYFREKGVAFATQATFVAAVSRALRVPEVDAKVFKHRITLNPGLAERRNSVDGYLDVLDAIYNYGAKGKRLPLKFRANEISRQRQTTFGKGNRA